MQTEGNGWSRTVYTLTPGIPGDSGSAFIDGPGAAIGVLQGYLKDSGLFTNNSTAKYPSMPRSLINANLSDFILRPAEMPEVMVRYAAHPYVAAGPAEVVVADRGVVRDRRQQLGGHREELLPVGLVGAVQHQIAAGQDEIGRLGEQAVDQRGVVELETPASLRSVWIDPRGRRPESAQAAAGHPMRDNSNRLPLRPPILQRVEPSYAGGFGIALADTLVVEVDRSGAFDLVCDLGDGRGSRHQPLFCVHRRAPARSREAFLSWAGEMGRAMLNRAEAVGAG